MERQEKEEQEQVVIENQEPQKVIKKKKTVRPKNEMHKARWPKPYSSSKKKKQIREKRQRKEERLSEIEKQEKKEELKYLKQLGVLDDHENISSSSDEEDEEVENQILSSEEKSLLTVFKKQTKKEIQRNIEISRKPLKYLSKQDEEYTYIPDFSNFIEIPKRPKWKSSMTAQEIEENEKKYFEDYLENLKNEYKNLNYFEQNIEVYRQLWRTIEFSDVVLLLVDIRHPLFHFPPSLYDYLVNDVKKPMILILNKCDLISETNVKLWKNYFEEKYPKLHCLPFSSFQNSKKQVNQKEIEAIWKKLSEIFQQKNDEIFVEYLSEMLMNPKDEEGNEKSTEKHDAKECITIGFLGHPNVGKSCLLNSLVGKHVVSTSSTPGHTKHYQTIFVSQHVRLCDCPGLVFPSFGMPKELQILCGLYPIAQVAEPYTSILYFAQRVDIVGILKLKHPRDEEEWSAWDICEAYTIKCGFYQRQGKMPDVYRGTNELLRMIYSGKLLFCFQPPK